MWKRPNRGRYLKPPPQATRGGHGSAGRVHSHRGQSRGRGRGSSSSSQFRGSHHTRGLRGGQRGHRGGHRGRPQLNHHSQRPKSEDRRPWHNFAYQAQVYLRDTFHNTAKETKKAEDHQKYLDQRDKVQRLEEQLQIDYFKQHPDQEKQWLPFLAKEAFCQRFSCDVCEVDYSTAIELQQHEESHEVCGLEGCTLIASPQLLEEHVMMVHASGLYARMTRGNSDEEIEKWQSERKKLYPTVALVQVRRAKEEEKQQQRQAMHERFKEQVAEEQSEIQRRKALKRKLDRDDRTVSEKRRRKLERREQRKRLLLVREKKPNIRRNVAGTGANQWSDESEAEDDVCQGVPAFPGTALAFLSEYESDLDESSETLQETEDLIDNRENIEKPRESIHQPLEQTRPGENDLANPSNSISDNSSLQENTGENLLTKDDLREKDEEINDDGPPEEISIRTASAEGINNDENVESAMQCKPPVMPPPSTTVFVGKTQYYREVPMGQDNSFRVLVKPKRDPGLLERMLAQEIRDERSEILQCVKYIVANNFFGLEDK